MKLAFEEVLSDMNVENRVRVLPFTDKASPEIIEREMGLSKNAFKRAVGRLLKEGKIQILEKSIVVKK